MAMNDKLKSTPTFNFSQGDFGDDNWELPITVTYYRDDVIELEQDGHAIILRAEFVQKLSNKIKKHLPEAKQKIEK